MRVRERPSLAVINSFLRMKGRGNDGDSSARGVASYVKPDEFQTAESGEARVMHGTSRSFSTAAADAREIGIFFRFLFLGYHRNFIAHATNNIS